MQSKLLSLLVLISLLLIVVATLPNRLKERKSIVYKDVARIICVSTLIALFTLLSGCGIIPERKREVQTTVYQYEPIPDNLLTNCPASRPPEKTEFIKATDKERIKQLSSYSMDLLKDLSNCDDQILKIRVFNEKQKTIYSGKVKTE